ncbi:LysM peptidoglycan-binding domain-containing protein [Marinomonas sp.]|nr:LysM peptidoglycan-binding domain-containing protein [Marinomonas sp.]MDB4837745.1 LysM peptidoglycan-binding domain-containing protein [Marinomonas sp.]
MFYKLLGIFVLSAFLSACQTVSNEEQSTVSTATIEEPDEGSIIKTSIESPTETDKTEELPLVIEVLPKPVIVIEEPKDLWDRVRAGYQLNLDVDRPQLSSQLRWMQSHPSYLDRVSKRGSRYLYYIVNELEKAGLPTEIALLPIVESGYDPFGYSHGRASGPWQFIPSTGHIYGLHQTWWYDGRRDIIGSTQAAIAYLTRLHKMFDGNWFHALASYNSGEGTVSRAIRKNKKAGKPTDFWSLDLPKETRDYVPKLIAIAKVIKNPEKYNYSTYPIIDEPYFEIVNIGGQLDLAQAAEMADISIDEIYLLNPGFNQWATSPDGPHRLLIPAEKANVFRTKLAQIPTGERVTWVRYTVKAGDNLLLIAKQHNTTANVLQSVNKISSSLIRVGQELMIPVAGNKIESYTLSSHQRLLAKQSRAPSNNRVKISHTIVSGDSLWSISKKYNTNSKTLARWNSMGLGDPLHPGKKLVVWLQSSKNTSNSTSSNLSRSVMKKVVYRIRSGESLSVVAQKFKVSVSNIKKWNPKVGSKKYVQPGDKVTLLINVVGG